MLTVHASIKHHILYSISPACAHAQCSRHPRTPSIASITSRASRASITSRAVETVSIRMQQKTAPSTPLHALLALHPMQQRPRRLHWRLQHMLTQTRARRTRKHHVSYTVSRACPHPCLPSASMSSGNSSSTAIRLQQLNCYQASPAAAAFCCLVPLPPRIPAACSLI